MNNSADSDLMSDNNFAFTQNSKGDIIAGGYKLQTEFTKGNSMVSLSNGNNNQSGGSFTSVLKDLAVPAGLFYLQQNYNKISKPYESAKQINKNTKKNKSSKISYNTDYVISENLFDKLLAMVEPQEKKNLDIKTRKRKNHNSKKTRKNRSKI